MFSTHNGQFIDQWVWIAKGDQIMEYQKDKPP